MSNNKKNNKASMPLDVKAFNFSSIPSILPIERPKGGRKSVDTMVYYGDNNLYPNFLLDLYNNSPINKGIINSKYTFIHGNGLIYLNSDEYAEFKVNEKETIEGLFEKIVKDFLIFNAYAIEVIYNKAGEQIKYNHIPVDRIRTSKNKQHFWYSDDWYFKSNESIHFDAWRPNENEEFTSKIFYYSAYTPNPSLTYPTVDYSGGIKSIENDIAIRDFHSNNLHTNFSVSSIITFFGGEPEDEVKDKLLKDLKDSYTGATGQRMLINFADESGKSAEVTNISASDFNEAFMTLKENTDADIVIAHSLPSPALAGIALQGQLGATQSLKEAYNIFRANWVLNKRTEILKSLNTLFNGYFNELDIKDDADRYGVEEIDPILKDIMTIDEIREMRGLPPLPNGAGQVMINKTPLTQQSIQPVQSKFSKEIEDDEIEDETFNKIQHFGLNKEDYVLLRSYKFTSDLKFDADQRLSNYLIANTPFAGQSLRSIQEKLNNEFTLQQIREEIAKLVNARVIPMTHLIDRVDIQEQAKKMNVNYKPSDTPNLNRLQTLYSYEGPADDRNRPTCFKLVRSNKFYSREEIQEISKVLGWDVFTHAMGKNCRHSWKRHVVVRKGDS
ncbi:hypothetical protein CHU00_14870 [Sphingobacterium cellulitidis]|uniref:hypothetical protein n=1 Tax=Sphingobacterium cellulitidis TaxID=1768011 RepID=UPI000B93E9FE|nr:hypothetical protein [Sphingobacterium cellulitidis]OYD44894.1 hypothetical protein CHU00_14870 [Sphingobacterium cellulitidis]